jgi:hypothetical protein
VKGQWTYTGLRDVISHKIKLIMASGLKEHGKSGGNEYSKSLRRTDTRLNVNLSSLESFFHPYSVVWKNIRRFFLENGEILKAKAKYLLNINEFSFT